jgi:hypothetical protein
MAAPQEKDSHQIITPDLVNAVRRKLGEVAHPDFRAGAEQRVKQDRRNLQLRQEMRVLLESILFQPFTEDWTPEQLVEKVVEVIPKKDGRERSFRIAIFHQVLAEFLTDESRVGAIHPEAVALLTTVYDPVLFDTSSELSRIMTAEPIEQRTKWDINALLRAMTKLITIANAMLLSSRKSANLSWVLNIASRGIQMKEVLDGWKTKTDHLEKARVDRLHESILTLFTTISHKFPKLQAEIGADTEGVSAQIRKDTIAMLGSGSFTIDQAQEYLAQILPNREFSTAFSLEQLSQMIVTETVTDEIPLEKINEITALLQAQIDAEGLERATVADLKTLLLALLKVENGVVAGIRSSLNNTAANAKDLDHVRQLPEAIDRMHSVYLEVVDNSNEDAQSDIAKNGLVDAVVGCRIALNSPAYYLNMDQSSRSAAANALLHQMVAQHLQRYRQYEKYFAQGEDEPTLEDQINVIADEQRPGLLTEHLGIVGAFLDQLQTLSE